MRRIIGVFRRPVVAWIIALAFVCAERPAAGESARNDGDVTITVSVKSSESAKYATAETHTREDWTRAWNKAKIETLTAPSTLYTDTYVEIAEGGAKRTFAMREDGVLFDPGANRSITLSSKVRRQWIAAAGALRKRHYGEIVEWDQAKSRIPRKAIVTVVDLETGLSFRAQRRAGSSHADVQPLTRRDTAVMKEIYGGKWSWRRRAIVVTSDDGSAIAASMHGMPHGGDGIPDNGFSGHFCIHFAGSTTHRSGKTDLSHQLMVHKAAGKLPEWFRASSPELRTEAIFDALHQQDEAVLRAALQGSSSETLQTFLQWLSKADAVRIEPPKEQDGAEDAVTADISVKAAWTWKGGGVKQETVRLQFARETVRSPWIITGVESKSGSKGNSNIRKKGA
ncbi:hypothetical protein [Paenibacillus sp. GYB003]|uniref:hypothetical protein n=1 Tax=Paenibacillus sp. GYB003 TaxID=2994392 RepID=UPI002F96A535